MNVEAGEFWTILSVLDRVGARDGSYEADAFCAVSTMM
jgi:hypothetical protein